MEITLTTWGQEEATAAEVMACVAGAWGMLSFWLLLSRGDTLHNDATQATAVWQRGGGTGNCFSMQIHIISRQAALFSSVQFS